MKRVLITGSQGYIGSVLSDVLTKAGHDCVGYDTGFFRDCLLYCPPETRVLSADVRSLSEAHLADVDVVVHLAGISNDPMGSLDPAKVYDPTRLYTLNIAKLCKKLGIRFIFASSCSVYGIGNDELLTESSPTNPQTFYSLNKQQIEDDLRLISDHSFSPIALRFATVFGSSPRLRFDVVINMLSGMAVADGLIILNSDGKAWRPNLHINDACQAIMHAIELDYKGGELMVLNIGSDDNNVRIIDIARTIQSIVPNSQLKFLSDDPNLDKEGLISDRKIKQAGADNRTYKVSFDKLASVLPTFKCEWSIEKGIRELVDRLGSIDFSHHIFKRKGFYRLQQLEYLLANGYISDELYWLKNSSFFAE